MDLDSVRAHGKSTSRAAWFMNPVRSMLWRILVPYFAGMNRAVAKGDRRLAKIAARGVKADAKSRADVQHLHAEMQHLHAEIQHLKATMQHFRAEIAKGPEGEEKSFSDFPGYGHDELAIFGEFHNPEAKAEPGFVVDFLGTRIRASSLWKSAQHLQGTLLGLPIPGDFHAEAAEWIGVLKCVKSARNQFVAMELGAGFGAWVVASANAARLKGIKQIRLCAVEADPQHFTFLRQHLLDNEFDPDEHLVLHAAVGTRPGTAQWPEVADANEDWGTRPFFDGACGDEGCDYLGRRFSNTMSIPVVPLSEIIRREVRWDVVHIDVQGHEVDICSSCIDEFSRRVHWLVVGLHSRKLDGDMIDLMYKAGWILENEKPTKFRFAPHVPTLEGMTILDGIQVWRNSALD